MPPITRKRKRDSETAVLNDIMIDNMGSFKTLPTEIIELVLCQLDAPSLSSLSCTCKKLRELTKSIWREICKRLSLDYNPTPLCVPSPSKITSQYSYDEALRRCTADEEKWRVHAVRNWLYSRWKCVVCYRTCSRRADPHRGILLCETCHPLFYRRKGNAKVGDYFYLMRIILIPYFLKSLFLLFCAAKTKVSAKEEVCPQWVMRRS